jgi:hypothetical protein
MLKWISFQRTPLFTRPNSGRSAAHPGGNIQGYGSGRLPLILLLRGISPRYPLLCASSLSIWRRALLSFQRHFPLGRGSVMPPKATQGTDHARQINARQAWRYGLIPRARDAPRASEKRHSYAEGQCAPRRTSRIGWECIQQGGPRIWACLITIPTHLLSGPRAICALGD